MSAPTSPYLSIAMGGLATAIVVVLLLVGARRMARWLDEREASSPLRALVAVTGFVILAIASIGAMAWVMHVTSGYSPEKSAREAWNGILHFAPAIATVACCIGLSALFSGRRRA